jgi:hypothetical protein
MRITAIVLIMFAIIIPSAALTDYQQGVLDGLSRGWKMGQNYDQAKTGDPTAYNQMVPDYNAWIESIFGKNESLMLTTIANKAQTQTYAISQTYSPVHAIDATWNQTKQSLLPDADAYGLIGGHPAETYYSIGPALNNF